MEKKIREYISSIREEIMSSPNSNLTSLEREIKAFTENTFDTQQKMFSSHFEDDFTNEFDSNHNIIISKENSLKL